MKRDIEKDLLAWKVQKNRLPLLIRGARQVGKTFTVLKFGKEHFTSLVSINFEQQPEFIDCFSTLDPKQIVAAIELLSKQKIIPGKTLLFLDEIQECPRAIISLRYFKEQLPELHVIGAGSLLEFILNDENFRMPVGRVEFLFMKPLSFGEFLDATGNAILREELKSTTLQKPIQNVIHNMLLNLVRQYINLGGMPAVVYEYSLTGDLQRCQEIQSALLATYRDDFGKYAKKIDYKNLRLLFEKAPGMIAQWFKYSKIDPDIRSRDLKSALEKLYDAGLIYLVYASSASGLPLIATMNSKKFKLLFLDIGLAKRSFHIDLELFFNEDLMLINKGALAEQFVGQELLAISNKREPPQLFFWVREQRGSSAEVDFLFPVDSQIIPIEVKAGSVGTLRSLKIYMDEKKAKLGIRISQQPLNRESNILTVPLYLVEEVPRLVKES